MKQLQKERDSNIELLRILSMLMIIAHHYVVNSGLTSLFSYPASKNMVFLQLFGFGGKIGINIFVLITGYYMCTKPLTLRRVLKVMGTLIFWPAAIYLIYNTAITHQPVQLMAFLRRSFSFLLNPLSNFSGTYIYLLFLVPALNLLIKQLTRRQLLVLICTVVFLLSGISTLVINTENWNYINWMATVYLIGGYLRKHPIKLLDSLSISAVFTLFSLSICWGSILFINAHYQEMNEKGINYYYYVSNSNKFPALLLAIAIFSVLRAAKIRPSRAINLIASTTFGVFLIHASSDLREYIWGTILKNVEFYQSPMLPLHAVASTIGIFVICSMMDLIRMYCIGKPMMRLLKPTIDKFESIFSKCFYTPSEQDSPQ